MERLTGGAVLAEGGNGCVFYPAVDGTKDAEKNVTKITSRRSALEEGAYMQYLHTLDPKGDHGIYIVGKVNCALPLKVLVSDVRQADRSRKLKRESTCRRFAQDVVGPKRGEYCAMTIPKYTHDAQKLPKCATLLTLKKMWIDLIESLIFFQERNCTHGDIKTDNIAYMGVETSKGPKMLLADWGWGKNLNNREDCMRTYHMMRRFPEYRPREFGGDMGIWSPAIFENPEVTDYAKVKAILLHNDAFSMCLALLDMMDQAYRTTFPELRHAIVQMRRFFMSARVHHFTANELLAVARSLLRV